MDRCEEKLDRFLNLMNEELIIVNKDESPYEFLLNLWQSDRECFFHVIRGSLKYMNNFSGMDSCIINVCTTIGQETKELIEEIALRRKRGSKWSSGFLTTAILLGSTKALDKFRKAFEDSFVCGLRSHEYDRVEVLGHIETVVFLKLISMQDLVARFAAMKNEQSHRFNKPPFWGIPAKLMPRRRQRWLNFIDHEEIKFAEAANVYFIKGSSGVREYLDKKNNSEFRAKAYLFCLACERNSDDLDYFKNQYKSYKDPILKNVCLESMIYLDQTKAAAFIDEELGKYNLDRLIKKKGHDFKLFYIWANDWMFYRLLESCYYLRSLNKGLIEKLKIITKSREAATSTPAMLILEKFRINDFEKKRIDSTQALLFKSLPSPARLLSMAKSSSRL